MGFSGRFAAIVIMTAVLGNGQSFNWGMVQGSKSLIWNPCYTEVLTVKYECARFLVPLDHSNPNGDQASIAMIRIPASIGNKNSTANGTSIYRGPILFNPGGPGASGVDFTLQLGSTLSSIVGPEFDIVGFDPRGIGRSLPRVSLFDDNASRTVWEESNGSGHGQGSRLRVLNATSDGLARTWARSRVVGKLAEDQSELLKHINTDGLARDMLKMVEAHGREKIQYWGFSWGTVLGSTFAAMFPDKIEKMVLDGVLDVEIYYKGLYTASVLDTDKTLARFFKSCFEAGPDICAFYDTSLAKIEANFNELSQALFKRPIPVAYRDSNNVQNFRIVDYDFIRRATFGALGSPYGTWVPFAQGLAELRKYFQERNPKDTTAGRTLVELFYGPQANCTNTCGIEKTFPVNLDGQLAFGCNDGDAVPDSLEEFEEYFKELTAQSQWGELIASVRASCIGWPELPKTQFRGPIRGNTSVPLLLVGNTADPLTPLQGAKKLSNAFPGSVVLTQDSPGHVSISAPSACTQQYVGNYFKTGALPPPGTVCPVSAPPFPVGGSNAAGDSDVAKGVDEL